MPYIYLSPSLQPFNPYINGGNEQQYMNLIADAMEPLLRANGIQYTRSRKNMTLRQVIEESNMGNYDLHLALHSNAAGPGSTGTMGTEVYYYDGSYNGQVAAAIIADNYKNIYPYPELVKSIATRRLAELNRTKAPAVLIETAYHDNPEDAQWIKDNIDNIAANLVQSLTYYFDIPFISDVFTPYDAVVSTQGGRLRLRCKPSTSSGIKALLENGTPLLVLGKWEDWLVVNANGLTGYVAAEFVSDGS